MAMSLPQEGSGFPFFAPCAYKCLCGMDPSAIAILPDEVPDFEAQALIEKVNGSVK